MEIGKREFLRNPANYFKIAETEKVIINHRGTPTHVLSNFNDMLSKQTFSSQQNKHKIKNIKAILDVLTNKVNI